MQSTRIFKCFVVMTCVLVALAYNTSREPKANDTPTTHALRVESLPPVATFSIVGFDPNTKELGIAVQSKFIAVGAVVPWAKAGVGAIATQSYANTKYGPLGLKYLAQGLSPKEVIEKLTADDSSAPRRQVGIVDADGRPATFTGREMQCLGRWPHR